VSDSFDAPGFVRNRTSMAADAIAASGRALDQATVDAAHRIAAIFSAGGKLLLCGNGGSAADAQHVAAEFVGRFLADRRALPAVALTTDSSALTAIANDHGFDQIFARQVEALAHPGDLLLAISTSGKSANILAAAEQAHRQRVEVIALTGIGPSALAELADLTLAVASSYTPDVQQAHITLLHIICELVERELFGAM
jgi:D-sedoheptulose 7-phosphate isomerase